jgi:hypothetical protein
MIGCCRSPTHNSLSCCLPGAVWCAYNSRTRLPSIVHKYLGPPPLPPLARRIATRWLPSSAISCALLRVHWSARVFSSRCNPQSVQSLTPPPNPRFASMGFLVPAVTSNSSVPVKIRFEFPQSDLKVPPKQSRSRCWSKVSPRPRPQRQSPLHLESRRCGLSPRAPLKHSLPTRGPRLESLYFKLRTRHSSLISSACKSGKRNNFHFTFQGPQNSEVIRSLHCPR